MHKLYVYIVTRQDILNRRSFGTKMVEDYEQMLVLKSIRTVSFSVIHSYRTKVIFFRNIVLITSCYTFWSILGYYQCVATNSAGTISATAYLLCNNTTNIPAAPKQVQCIPFDENNICVRWTGTKYDTAYSVYSYDTASNCKYRENNYVLN